MRCGVLPTRIETLIISGAAVTLKRKDEFVPTMNSFQLHSESDKLTQRHFLRCECIVAILSCPMNRAHQPLRSRGRLNVTLSPRD
jgi:hypothetical protein